MNMRNFMEENNMKYAVSEIVSKIIGKIHSVGSTETDEGRFENLKMQCELINELLDEVIEESKNNERNEYSMQKSGEFAHEFLTKLKEDLDDVLDD